MYPSRLQMHPPPAPALSSAHSYTLIAPDDDDDSDICPVCDGECTCTKLPPPPPRSDPAAPLSMAELSMRWAASSPPSPSSGPPTSTFSSPAPAPQKPHKQPLKIKLTVPPGLLARRSVPPPSTTATSSSSPPSSTASSAPLHRSYPTASSTTSGGTPAAYTSPANQKAASAPRGRPAYKPLNPKSAAPGKHPRSASTANKVRQNLKARAKAKKAAASRRRRIVSSDDDESTSSPSEMSDADMPLSFATATQPRRPPVYAPDPEEDDGFPTFVSASALSSLSSDSSSSSASSTFGDSDSDVQAEEENFIRADVARRGDWVIRSRKKSVGLSDAEMEVDSDATEDEEGEAGAGSNVDADLTEEDSTATMLGLAPTLGDEDESMEERRYTGHATGWSEDDDESSFDADLFFANLSGSSSSTSGSDADSDVRGPIFNPASVDDGEASDFSGTTETRGMQSLPFEVAEGWDGQLVFTNGSADVAAHIVDLEFEADARGFGGGPRCTGGEGGCEYEVQRRRRRGRSQPWGAVDEAMYDAEAEDGEDDLDLCSATEYGLASDAFDNIDPQDDEEDEEGYAEDSGGECEGDTTDEELVGADALPNARAMSMFNLPQSVSAINPLSTVSSPTVSPGRTRLRGGLGFGLPSMNSGTPVPGLGKSFIPGWDLEAERRERERAKRQRMWGGEGVRAQDILEGRVLFWDSDEQAHDVDEIARRRRMSRSYSRRRNRWSGSGTESDIASGSGGRSGSGSEDGRRRMRTPHGPRQGVFVASAETRLAVIGDSQKGAAVPSPHPRFKGRGARRAKQAGGSVSTVEHLLRAHLLQSIASSGFTDGSLSNSMTLGTMNLSLGSPLRSTPQSPAESADMCASLDLLFQSATQVLSASEDSSSLAMDVDPSGSMATMPDAQPEPIQLDDVLDAAFLDDSVSEASGSGAQADQDAGNSASHQATASGSGSGTRWDVISVGAFRQTREAGSWDRHHVAGSSTDFGAAMRPAPMGAMLWQQSAGSSSNARNGAGSSVKGIKHAKRRQMMLGAAGMASPLVLPSSSGGSAAASPAMTPNRDRMLHASGGSSSGSNNNGNNKEETQKSRRELRRERKVQKKAMKAPPAAYGHGYGHSHAHQFHTHQHHPNAKLRGAGASQRMNFFGGAVLPPGV